MDWWWVTAARAAKQEGPGEVAEPVESVAVEPVAASIVEPVVVVSPVPSAPTDLEVSINASMSL